MFSAENAEMSYACDQQSEIDRLRELNAELLAALEAVVAIADRETDPFIRARAVIAKAKGEA